MAQQALKYVFYIAATPQEVWEGFVSEKSKCFTGHPPRSRSIVCLAPVCSAAPTRSLAVSVTWVSPPWCYFDLNSV